MADGLTLETALPPDGTAAVEALGPVEALVAVTALNQARTAPAVVEAVAAGLGRGFAGRKTAVLFVDGGSQDGTFEAVAASVPRRIGGARRQRAASPAARGAAAPCVAGLAAARHVGARAASVVDAGLSASPPSGSSRCSGPRSAAMPTTSRPPTPAR